MRIFAIDDEPEVLETLHEAIGDAVPDVAAFVSEMKRAVRQAP